MKKKAAAVNRRVNIQKLLKEGLQSVLRIGSAHNKGGPPNILSFTNRPSFQMFFLSSWSYMSSENSLEMMAVSEDIYDQLDKKNHQI